MSRSHTIIDSPIDSLTLVADNGKLCGVYMDTHKPAPDTTKFGDRTNSGFEQIVEQLAEYFSGERKTFDVELAPVGSEFQHLVWNGLRTIPYGETISYGELATRIGKPGAARAVGAINGQNPISIVVPCHRVIGANGKLVGYAGGMTRKEYLLGLEQALTPVQKADAPSLFALLQ